MHKNGQSTKTSKTSSVGNQKRANWFASGAGRQRCLRRQSLIAVAAYVVIRRNTPHGHVRRCSQTARSFPALEIYGWSLSISATPKGCGGCRGHRSVAAEAARPLAALAFRNPTVGRNIHKQQRHRQLFRVPVALPKGRIPARSWFWRLPNANRNVYKQQRRKRPYAIRTAI